MKSKVNVKPKTKIKSKNRLSWDEYFLKILIATSERSTCPRAVVGAIITKDNKIIATGYNGAPNDMPHCTDVGCAVGEDDHCHRAVHAEINAIIQASGSSQGGTLYCTHKPCLNCSKAIIQAGIKEVKYIYEYYDNQSKALNVKNQTEYLNQAGLKVTKLGDE